MYPRNLDWIFYFYCILANCIYCFRHRSVFLILVGFQHNRIVISLCHKGLRLLERVNSKRVQWFLIFVNRYNKHFFFNAQNMYHRKNFKDNKKNSNPNFLDIQCMKVKSWTLIELYRESAHKFAFSTFLTAYFLKIRERPQTIYLSNIKLATSLMNKQNLIKVYD